MDVIVVGAGVIGLAAGFELSRAGHRVTVVSADVPGSRQSAGLSRIFRLAHADRGLTDAAARSMALWQAWEAAAGDRLLDRTGLLLTGDMSERAPHLRRHGGLQALAGEAHPLAVARDGWFFEPTGAAIRAEVTTRFLQAELDVMLADVTAVDGGGIVLGDGGRRDAERVVVCAGPDTYRLLGMRLPARLRSVRFSFAVREPLTSSVPCWIQRDDRLSEPFYAVMDGADHYSVGLSEAAPAEVPEAAHIRDAHRRITDIVTRVLPGLVPVAERVIACEYTSHPEAGGSTLAHDGWDLPERDGVLGVTGPSLFKFAPLLGRLVTERLGAGIPSGAAHTSR
ncbi:MAG TPA: FAD-dependent oxidoreductase [Solirubrobacteraceae bacterium]|jgi:sarcosine oxidase|nr:FAD-dependent oxidoreductase [Solirubrobacteraceae bacterium]